MITTIRVVAFVKLGLAFAAAAIASGLITPDPQITAALLAAYAAVSGGNNLHKPPNGG
jgi:hypothetical protein